MLEFIGIKTGALFPGSESKDIAIGPLTFYSAAGNGKTRMRLVFEKKDGRWFHNGQPNAKTQI